MLKIEKKVPIPERGRHKYPFKDMNIGDSFVCPLDACFRNNVYSMAIKLGIKVKTAKEGDNLRVWRIS